MSEESGPRTVIGPRTAFVLYAVLVLFAIATCKGRALAIALFIVLGLAVKSYVGHVRNRLE
jgi:hypothetical protein